MLVRVVYEFPLSVINATFNTISVISWHSFIGGKDQRPAASDKQTQ
jgi:hypothetical protein